MILDKTQVLKDLSFVENNTSKGDRYLCSCGHKFNIKNENEELHKEISLVNDEVTSLINSDLSLMEDLSGLYKDINMSMHEKIECPSCKKSFMKDENRKRLISKGHYFVSGFKFEDTADYIKLYYSKLKLEYVKDFDFTESYKYLKIEKNTNKLFWSDYDNNEIEFDLDEIVDVLNKFLLTDVNVIHNAFDLHTFINSLSNLVVDRRNIDVTTELLNLIKGAHNDMGISTIKKVIIVFLAIIKYSNLSTIAITKGPLFLYDMMVECKLPKPEVLVEKKITSPIKIFNFLAQNYVKDLSQDIVSENKESKEFSFKSKQLIEFEAVKDKDGNELKDSLGDVITKAVVKDNDKGRVLNINFSDNKNYKTGKVKDTGSGFGIIEDIEDGSVSKFIFKNIKKFSDYKYIIKYFKLLNKQEIIVCLQKYDLDFLSHAIDLLYFRDKGIDFKEFQRVLDIMLDYVEGNSKKDLAILANNNLTEYSKDKFSTLKDFDFIPYDDSLMMMTVLKFDRRRHFDKIKTWKELNEYHDNLVKYFQTIKDEEKNGSIGNFVSQFEYLTNRENYNGPIHINLLSTPAMIIKEGIDLRHSGGAYAKNVASRTYLMAQIFDRDEDRPSEELERYTIGFKYDKHKGLVFDQVKGFANKTGSDRFKNHMMVWLENKDISFQPIKDLKIESM